MKYISLLLGTNISEKNKIIMKDLNDLYESLGFENVMTYIQSDNVIFKSFENENILVEKNTKSYKTTI